MLIVHEIPGTYRQLSPEEQQQLMAKYQLWTEKVRSAGRLVASDKLKEEGGKVLRMDKGRLAIVDGPYSEAKEVVGGYFVFRAQDYEEAVEIARGCPHLPYGRIELRQTDPMGCGGE
jgi:hypothetical protein